MTELKRRILDDIVQKASKTKYNDVAPLLLKAKVVVEPPNDGRQRSEHELETERRGGKRLIWQSHLIDLLADSLYRDYLKVDNDWLCAAELCQLVVNCCAASEDLTHDPEFRRNVLQKTSKGLWQLLHNIHQRVDWGIDNAVITRANNAFQSVCTSSHHFLLEFPDFILDGWQSAGLVAMLEDKIIRSLDWLLLDLCTKLTKLNQSSVLASSAERRQRIMDAAVEILHRAEDSKIANSSTQFLVAWLDAYPLALSSLVSRHGDVMKTLLEKWRGHGFDVHTNVLRRYMSSGVVADGNVQRVHEAAAKIQASYRAYLVRRRIAKMKSGFVKLQQLFRLRRQKSADTSKTSAKKFEASYQENVKRYKKDRRYLEKRMQTVSCIHASLVDQYLETEADRAATIIQAAWRGYWTRKTFKQRLLDAKLDKAARIIQKNMRRWYEKRRLIKNRLREWPGLTETRREQLQSIIDRYQERYKTRRPASKQAQRELHEKAQSLLIDHYKRRYSSLNAYQKREAALGRLRMNIQFLETAPKLTEVTERDVITFSARSEAIANRANRAHKEELRFQRLPKWRQLLKKSDQEVKDRMY